MKGFIERKKERTAMTELYVIITDLSGYSFEVKWNRNIRIVKSKIAKHY